MVITKGSAVCYLRTGVGACSVSSFINRPAFAHAKLARAAKLTLFCIGTVYCSSLDPITHCYMYFVSIPGSSVSLHVSISFLSSCSQPLRLARSPLFQSNSSPFLFVQIMRPLVMARFPFFPQSFAIFSHLFDHGNTLKVRLVMTFPVMRSKN